MSRNYYIPLNQTILVVVPERDRSKDGAHIVQVTVQSVSSKRFELDIAERESLLKHSPVPL